MASKADMTPEEREAKEQEEFSTGPLRVLTDSVKNNTQVLKPTEPKNVLPKSQRFPRHQSVL